MTTPRRAPADMTTVWKFPLHGQPFDTITLRVPTGAVPLHVGEQDGRPCVWMRVDPEADDHDRAFKVVGTGHPIPSGWLHAGTWFSGPFVWHLFMEPAPADRRRDGGDS